jgi:hypothetical protein
MHTRINEEMDALTRKASKYTSRDLTWRIRDGILRLGDGSRNGDLYLVEHPAGVLHEVYMNTRSFGFGIHEHHWVLKALQLYRRGAEFIVTNLDGSCALVTIRQVASGVITVQYPDGVLVEAVPDYFSSGIYSQSLQNN